MMGDGFAVIPASREVSAPTLWKSRQVSSLQSMQLGYAKRAEGAEVLIHMGTGYSPNESASV